MKLAFGLILLVATTPAFADSEDHTIPLPPNQTIITSVADLRIPEKAWDHYLRAREAILAHDEQQFQRETEAALKVEPNFAAIYVLKATHNLHTGHLQAGLQDVLTARRIEPGVNWSGVTLASAYNGLHRYQDAYLILNSTRAPESTTWQAAYEMTRASIGRASIADALYWSALTLKLAPPTCREAHILRGNSLLLAQRLPEAASELRLYLAAEGPEHPHPDIEKIAHDLDPEPSLSASR